MRRNILLLVATILAVLAVAEWALRLAPPLSLLAKLPNRPYQDTILATDEFSTRVVTNSRGLRETREIGPPRADVFRIAAVGDSFTWGWGADNDATYPAKLETLLRERTRRAIEVVNVSTPGHNLADYLSLVRNHALPLRPDAVVVGTLLGYDCPLVWPLRTLSEDQIAETIAAHGRQAFGGRPKGLYLRKLVSVSVIQPARDRLLARLAPSENHAIAGGNPLAPESLARLIGDSPEKAARAARLEKDGWIQRGRRWSVSPWLVVSAIEAPGFLQASLFLDHNLREAMDNEWRVCEGVVDKLRATVEAAGARFMLVVFPSSVQVDPEAVRHRRALGFAIDERALSAREPNRRFAAICARKGIQCVDTSDALLASAARGERPFYPLDGHPTPNGYARIAERVADSVLPWIGTVPK